MNTITKKLMALGISTALFASCIPVLAQDDATSEGEIATDMLYAEELPTDETLDATESVVYELTLEEAVNMALLNNPQLLAADAKIKSSELSLEVVNETQKEFDKMSKYVNVPVKISDGLDVAYLKHGYYPVATKVGLDLAVLEKDKITATIAYDVIQKYYNVKLMEKLIDISEAGVKIAKDNADVVKKSYELGYVSQLEVKNVDASVAKAEFSVEANKRNLSLATESLKIALHVDGTDCSFVLTDDIVLPDMPSDAEEKMNEAMNSRYDVTALKKAYELSEMYFDITNDYVGDSTSLYNNAYSDYLNAKYTYENSAKLIKLSLKSDYAAILTAKDNVIAAENALNIKQIEYDSAVIKYDIGMITNLALTAAMTELDGCKVELENARLTYLMAVLKFNYNTTIGI